MAERLVPGDIAPDFTAPAVTPAGAGTFTLADHRGTSVILYVYPAAGTPGCTREADDFQGALGSLSDAGYLVAGISPDGLPKLARFADKHGLTFPLISDTDREIMARYGAYGEKKLYGKTVTGVIRSTFVIGPDGRITLANYGVKATGHVARLRRDLGLDA
jgi:peroxiredoxin Q/BCP